MKNTLVSLNPATEVELARYETDNPAAIDQKIKNAASAAKNWAAMPVAERAAGLRKLADYLSANKEVLADIATAEMGKPRAQSIAEVEKCALSLTYYADHGEQYLKNEAVASAARKSFVTFQPLGVVLAIMPWNFPFWQVFRALGPILISGNTMLLKHASNVTGCAIAMEQAVRKAGLTEGVFQALLLPSSEIEPVIAHGAVQAVTFTGSTEAGRKVAAMAGRYLKKQVLELGGSDAYVVLEDADLAHAVATCVKSRLNNSGQSCIAAKRFIVTRPVVEAFTRQLTEVMKAKTFGDPTERDNDIGPLARKDLRDALHRQVEKSVKMGASLLCGGYIPDKPGAYYPPTVLSGVKKGMPAYDEELFGPVAAVIEASDESDAIARANDSIYGLGGAVFTSDIARGEQLATTALAAGSVFVNEMVSSNPLLPFGGIKSSGYGRELSYFAIREFVNIKTVFIK